ncbi:MAG: DUF2497 domain-containing protein [Pseudomonadota bacterium]
MANPQAEPSMDEILASIRRIISEEDDAPASDKAAASLDTLDLDEEAAVATSGEEEASPSEDQAQTVAAFPSQENKETSENLDVSEEIAALDAPTSDEILSSAQQPQQGEDLTVTSAATSSALSDAVSEAVQDELTPGDIAASLAERASPNMVSADSAGKAAEAFGTLEQNMRLTNSNSRTIEDVIEAMLAPMLKQWLDENLPRIVEDKVEEEVRRIARRR